MENKIDIAELLKDCPSGMELDCTVYDNVTLGSIMDGNCYPIQIQTPEGNMLLSKYGCMSLSTHSKCVIFPKGKTTWEGFVPPCKFKDGDIVISDMGDIHLLRTKDSSCCAYRKGKRILPEFDSTLTTNVTIVRLATEEEKQKLFDAIKANGYKWNPETKTLEKLPKFKVGDKIVKKDGISVPILITGVGDTYYWFPTKNSIKVLPIAEQDDWELVPHKFDVTTLKPYDKVLVRLNSLDCWHIQYFEKYDKGEQKYHFICLCECKYEQCIPYEENKHLLNTSNNCNNYYKTWE